MLKGRAALRIGVWALAVAALLVTLRCNTSESLPCGIYLARPITCSQYHPLLRHLRRDTPS